ncbi:transmembrane channel-like protein [Plakobranchus ocellatus]|uniref:Transmembrane channel-like protein n=1 Tax=Plakobranchus ocellatus TaxID=259542 RepID=A0AAV4ADR5_9GAST|nr:transmembrane channel-like protein [Plakobranchus ocellatus]
MDEAGEDTPLLSRTFDDRSYRSQGSRRSVGRDRSAEVDVAAEYANVSFGLENGVSVPYLTSAASGPGGSAQTPSNNGAAATITSAVPSGYVTGNRPYTEDDLLFKLKFAHLSTGTNWYEELASVNREPDDLSIFIHVLATVREYPLSMKEKLALYRQLRHELAKTYEVQIDTRQGNQHRSKGRGDNRNKRKYPARSSFSYLSPEKMVTFELWGSNIARIAAYFGTNVASFFRFLRFLIFLNVFLGLLMFSFISLPQIISGDLRDADVRAGFFGQFSKTIFFFGAYKNTTLSSKALGITWTYSLPLAYFMTWAVVSLLALVIIIMRTDYSGDDPYASHTLVGWDYSITSKQGTKIRSKAITTTLKEMMREEQTRTRIEKYNKAKLLATRVLGTLFHLAVLAGSALLIFLVAESSLDSTTLVPDALSDFVEKYELSLLVSAMKLVIPPILSFLLKFEHYKPRTRVKVEIARIACYYVASLLGFLISTYSVARDCASKTDNSTDIKDIVEDGAPYCCWENKVGEQLLQLVLLDLVVSIGVRLGQTGGRALLAKYLDASKVSYEDFPIARLILDLVYNQCLVWLGLYFMPALSLLVAVNQVILFYFTYVLSLTCNVPPAKVFRASRSGTFYLFVLAVSLFACFLPMAFGVIELEPSASCGPFKQDIRAYDVLVDRIGQAPGFLQDTVHFVSTPGFVLPVIMTLVFIVLYYRTKSGTHEREAKDLRLHLQFERKVQMRRIIARHNESKGVSAVLVKDVL